MRTWFASACLACAAWAHDAVGGEVARDQVTGCSFEVPVKPSGMYNKWNGACENGRATGPGVANAAYLIKIEGEYRDGKPFDASGRFVRRNGDGLETFLLVSYVRGTENIRHPFDKADAERIDLRPLIGNWQWRQEGPCAETHEYTADSTEIVRSGEQRLNHFVALFPVAGAPGWAEIVRTSSSHNGKPDCHGKRIDHIYDSSHTFVRFMDDGSLKLCNAARDDACFATATKVPVPPPEERILISAAAGINSASPSRTTAKVGERVADQSPAGIRKHIDEVFDRNKGVLYALYGRALRDSPKLEGKFTADIDISTEGTVSGCSVLKSELHAPDLEQKLCARIRLIRFGLFDNPQSVTKAFDFYPAQ